MFGSATLEVAIGLFLVYLLLSMIVSGINEQITALMALRARKLEEGLHRLLNDADGGGLAKDFWTHPLVERLARQGTLDKLLRRPGRPSYIPNRIFALTLLDLVAPATSRTGVPAAAPAELRETAIVDEIRTAIATLPYEELKRALLVLVDDAHGDLQRLHTNLETWFDDAMERVSGQYKRYVQVIILILSLSVSAFFNADTLTIADALARDPALRAAAVTVAEQITAEGPPAESGQPQTEVAELQRQFQGLGLPIGWSDSAQRPQDLRGWVMKIAGLLLTGFAISLGAPFWFDIVQKLLRINPRLTGEKSSAPEEETRGKTQ